MTTTSPRDVGRMLTSYSRRAQETWAQARGLDPQRLPGPALPKELTKHLLAPAKLKAALAETTPDERLALARIKAQGDKIPATELKPQLRIDGLEDPDAVIARLMSRGLLFYDRSHENYYGRWELWGQKDTAAPGVQPLTYHTPYLWLPGDISELVTVPEDLGRRPLEPAHPHAGTRPPEVREPPFATLQRDIYLVLQSLREEPVKLLKSGGVGKRESERLLKILPTAGAGENDPTAKARADGSWFRFLWLLLQRAELLHERSGCLTASTTGLQFLGLSEAQQARTLLRAWTGMVEWNEFRRVPALQLDNTFDYELQYQDLVSFDYIGGAFGDVPSPPQIAMARLALMELILREQPYPGWFSVDSLLASMQRFRLNFLIPRSDLRRLSPWAIASGPEDRSYRGFSARGSSPLRRFNKDTDWNEVEGAFLRTLLEEPFLWLGIVRLGYRDGELVAFELTERGAAALDLIQAPAPPARRGEPAAERPAGQRALVVQPNFEMVVYPEVAGISLLIELDRFAERVRMDRAALYRLTRADLCRGLQSGLTLAEITRTLESYNAAPLPQNVAYSLAEWERLYNRIHVHRAVSLIEAADDAELRALCALPELKEAREIAPRLLLVPSGVSLRGLRTKPEVIDYKRPIVDAIEFETATRLRVLHPTPRLQHRLLQIADPVTERDEGRGMRDEKKTAPSHPSSLVPHPSLFELSREKVSHAARWWKWEAIQAFLTEAARAKPPAELAVRLKGWAGELAPAAVTSLTLLAAPSAEWLDEVMRVPGVKRFIVHRLSSTMALVAEENRAALQAALEATGVSTHTDVRVQDLLAAEARAAAEAGETLLVGPPRKRRALIERAIAEHKRVTIALMPYSGKLAQTKVEPVRIEGEGAGARLVARIEGLRYEQSYSLNQIQGVRMLDEPAKS